MVIECARCRLLVAAAACVAVVLVPRATAAQNRSTAPWTLASGAEAPAATLVGGGGGSYWLVGAGAGLVVGATATYVVTHVGGSTSLCDRSRNQDALSSRECAGLVVLGGAVGAGLGALIGGRIHRGPRQQSRLERVRLQALPGRRTRIGVRMTR